MEKINLHDKIKIQNKLNEYVNYYEGNLWETELLKKKNEI
jgi:hypothetical protein